MSKKLIDPCPNRRYNEIYEEGLEWINTIEYLDYEGMSYDYDYDISEVEKYHMKAMEKYGWDDFLIDSNQEIAVEDEEITETHYKIIENYGLKEDDDDEDTE